MRWWRWNEVTLSLTWAISANLTPGNMTEAWTRWRLYPGRLKARKRPWRKVNENKMKTSEGELANEAQYTRVWLKVQHQHLTSNTLRTLTALVSYLSPTATSLDLSAVTHKLFLSCCSRTVVTKQRINVIALKITSLPRPKMKTEYLAHIPSLRDWY